MEWNGVLMNAQLSPLECGSTTNRFRLCSELLLSAKTVKDRIVKMSLNITNQQTENLKLISALSIAVDESCDINETALVSLLVRFVSSTALEKELLGLLKLKGQTRGEGIGNAVINA
ncbi:hypothetical protein AVEN_24829-1 [Araneus ventricosus]|uniref:DUF4371 domain-containing protein n=1 Tax=Araneus ventricosus TaxID=182803 RepID=A0A4Y2BWW7_ARAVE|nr:hypothetical protein AVEN_24829-1 [Araneus ventricosus]